MGGKVNGAVAKTQCTVSRVQNGIVYRCCKEMGHDLHPGDEEHVARAAEYTDSKNVEVWRMIAEASRPLLEWLAANPEFNPHRAEAARRVLVRMYIASTPRPGLTKTS